MSEILLQTHALTKQYGHQKAVDNVDIHIKKGAIYGFIGRNGAGKTTCMRMICGLAKPTSGDIDSMKVCSCGLLWKLVGIKMTIIS